MYSWNLHTFVMLLCGNVHCARNNSHEHLSGDEEDAVML